MAESGTRSTPAVRVTVGVLPTPTLKAFKEGIREVVNQINENPAKIRFVLDDKSISEATKKALEVNKALEGIGVKSPSKQVNSIKSQIQDIKSAYQTFEGLNSIDINNDSFVSLGKNIEECDKLLEACGTDTKRFLKTFATDGAEGKRIIEQMVVDMQKLQGASNAYIKINGLTDSALTGDYKKILPKLEAAGKTAELSTLKSQYDELMLLDEQWKASGSNKNDPMYTSIIQKKEALRQLITEQQSLINSTEQLEKSEESSTKTKNNETNIIKRYTAAVSQGEKCLQNWSKAEHSKSASSRDAYVNLKNSIVAMQNAKSAYDQGVGSIENLDNATKRYRITLNESRRIIQANGDASKTLTERIGGLASKFGAWLSVSQVIMYGVRTVRKMVETSIELDSAMTQMQIVTKASDVAIRKFGDDAAEAAQKTASSITDIVDSATTYARLGYNTDEATQLAKYTTMLKNVGDIEVSDAQDAITAIVKAYDVDAKDIESVMDKLVETGNNFPISVSQIAEGMNNASSSLSAAGNSFEQSVALLTAANTTLQDSAKSSTGLRTIAARIRKVKTELDDLGESMTDAEYDKMVKSLTHAGVQITDGTGEIRDTYSIMKDIAKVWDNLSSMEQSGLATELSGTRQQAVFYSIINNFKEASGAMDAMKESGGALDTAYSTYLDSTQAHIDKLTATFQTLSQDVMNSGLLKFFIDFGAGAIQAVDGITKVFGGLPSVVAGAIAAIKTKNIGRVRMFTLDLNENMPIVTIVLFGHRQFRCYG